MKKSSSVTTYLLKDLKLARPTSIQRSTKTNSNQTLKQNQANFANKDYEIIRIKSSNRLIIRNASLTSIEQKKRTSQPHRKLVKPTLAISKQIHSTKQIPRVFKRKINFFPQSQKQIPIQQVKFISRKNNDTLKQSKVQRKPIVRNPFQKRQLQIQFQKLSKCDESQIAYMSERNEDISEIKQIVKDIKQQYIN